MATCRIRLQSMFIGWCKYSLNLLDLFTSDKSWINASAGLESCILISSCVLTSWVLFQNSCWRSAPTWECWNLCVHYTSSTVNFLMISYGAIVHAKSHAFTRSYVYTTSHTCAFKHCTRLGIKVNTDCWFLCWISDICPLLYFLITCTNGVRSLSLLFIHKFFLFLHSLSCYKCFLENLLTLLIILVLCNMLNTVLKAAEKPMQLLLIVRC